MSAEQQRRTRALVRAVAVVFVEIAGGNRVRCFSTLDLVVVINHTGRFERVFAHACAYTTARPHDRTTARPHDRTTTRPHDDHEISRRFGRLPGRFSSKWPTETGKANGKQKRVCVSSFYETHTCMQPNLLFLSVFWSRCWSAEVITKVIKPMPVYLSSSQAPGRAEGEHHACQQR